MIRSIFSAFVLFVFALCSEVNPSYIEEKPLSAPPSNTLFSVDFLFWGAGIDGTDLVISGHYFENPDTGLVVDRGVVGLEGKWEPGVRASLGYQFGWHDEWNLSAIWTYYHDRSKTRSVTTTGDLYLRQSWINFLGSEISFAKGHWNLNLNVFDLNLARTYTLTNHIKATPYIAARCAFVYLDLQAGYTGIWIAQDSAFDPPVLYTANTSFKGDSDYRAGGLVAGTNVLWNFTPHWGLLGEVGVSLLYGQFNVKETFNGADLYSNPAELDTFVTIYRDKALRMRAVLDLLLGVQWQTSFCRDRSNVSLFVGYELFQWFALNRLFTVDRSIDSYPLRNNMNAFNANFNLEYQNGDIGLQGLTAKINFAF